MCGQPPSQLSEQAGDSWTGGGGGAGGAGGGGGLVLHEQPRFQLKQGLTLIPAPHTNTHEAEHIAATKHCQRTPLPPTVPCLSGFTARSASRVKVGILISERRVEARKPQVNIHPCVMAKWITFATQL